MNRIERLSAIIVLLQTKKIVKASEISERFDISLRTVYRDMQSLNEAGIPLGAEAGKGYYLVDGYHLPPVMFTPEEAGAMLIAGKLTEKFSDNSVKKSFNLATDKIKSVMPESHKNFIDSVSPQVLVLFNKNEKEAYSNNYLNIIQLALSEKKCLKIRYFSFYNQKENSRIIEPIGLCFYSFQWHLIAFCTLRDAYRDFRLDRILDLQVNEEQVCKGKNYSLSEYFEHLWNKEDLINVSLGIDKKQLDLVLNSRNYYGFYDEEDKGDYIEMKFAVNEHSYMIYWILSLGSAIVSIHPEELLLKTKEHISMLHKIYNS